MAAIPSFRFDITGASGSQGLLSPKQSWRAYVFPRGANASQDSTGTLITFDSAAIASRFAVNNWIQVGTATSKIVRVTAVGGNSISVNSAVTVTTNDRVFLIGNTQPSVSGGSATYITPNTLVRQRGDDGATLYTNSLITTNVDGLVQGYALPAMYDVMVQDGNQGNQGYVADLEVGTVEGVSVTDNAIFGASVTLNNLIVSRFGVASGVSLGGAIRIVDGSRFTTIQAAINDLPAAGGVVDARGFSGSLASGITISTPCTLLIGAATITSTADPLINITTSNVAIVGIHQTLSILQNTTATANVIRVAAGLSNILLSDLTFDAGGKTIDEANRTQGNCVWGAGTTGSNINGIVMTRCRLLDGNNGFLGEFTNRCHITDNLFDFSHAALAQLSFRSGDDNIISNNVFLDSGGSANAIYILHAADDASTRNAISDNVINGDYDFEAINLFGSFSSVTGNVILQTNTPAGIAPITLNQPVGDAVSQCHHNVVKGNVVRSTGVLASYGIHINDASAGNLGANDNIISDNIVQTAGIGILVSNFCLRNVIRGNRVDIETGATSDGIGISGANIVDTIVSGNHVTDATRYGIYTNTSTRNIVEDNYVASSTNDGIRLDTATSSSVVGNYTRANGGYGIIIATGGTGLTVADNHSVSDTSGALDPLTQTITAVGQAITLRSNHIQLDADASYVLTSAPTLADGFNRQRVTITNVDTADVITIQDQGSLASSNLRLGAASRALGPRDNIMLEYNSTVGDWIEISFSNVI